MINIQSFLGSRKFKIFTDNCTVTHTTTHSSVFLLPTLRYEQLLPTFQHTLSLIDTQQTVLTSIQCKATGARHRALSRRRIVMCHEFIISTEK